MATSNMNEVVQHLRRSVLQREQAGRTDAQLLRDYIGRHDPAALAALVHRHGPMVWGVCSRILSNPAVKRSGDLFRGIALLASPLLTARKTVTFAARIWTFGPRSFRSIRAARALQASAHLAHSAAQ